LAAGVAAAADSAAVAASAAAAADDGTGHHLDQDHTMKNHSTKRFLGALVTGVAVLAGASGLAVAADVKLSGGGVWRGDAGARVRATFTERGRQTTVEGVVVRAETNLVVLEIEEGGGTVRKTIVSFDLKKLETLDAAPAAAPSGADAASPAGDSVAGAAPAADGVIESAGDYPNIFILPWEGTVGIGARHDEIEAIGKEADKYGPGQIIVLQVDSPGGLVIEGDKIHETMKDLKRRHRVVAWIKKAISAGAFTSLHCDEIYFMRIGTLGSITMFSGTTSVQGARLEAWLDKCGEACMIGGRFPGIGRAMVTNPELLSYDKDDETGVVTWYATLEGRYKLSDAEENLTFNAENALHSGFADGVADTEEELAKLLQLPEWKEASDVGRKIHADWQRTLKECEKAKPLLFNDLQNPAGSDEIAQMGNQIKALTEIAKWYDRCYPMMVYEQPSLGPDKERVEDMIEDLRRRIADMKRARRG
jgi:hypothetical protein